MIVVYKGSRGLDLGFVEDLDTRISQHFGCGPGRHTGLAM